MCFNRFVRLVARVGCTLDVASFNKDLVTRSFIVFATDIWQCSAWSCGLTCTASDSVYIDVLV